MKLYLYRPAFLHAKHMTVDDTMALIGSSNMDIRSFVLNSEITLIVYDQGFTKKLQAEQARYLSASEELTCAQWQQRGILPRFTQNLARLMSPLL